MIYIETNSATNAVGFVHYMPFDENNGMKNEDGTQMTEEQLKETGFLVESMPEAEKIKGKGSTTFYTEEKGFWFEYYDVEVNDYPQVPLYFVNKIQDDMTLALVEAGVL